jgi:hypothetical protein
MKDQVKKKIREDTEMTSHFIKEMEKSRAKSIEKVSKSE